MTRCCYKTRREDPSIFSKIDAVSTSQLLTGNTKEISNQYFNAKLHGSTILLQTQDSIVTIQNIEAITDLEQIKRRVT